MVVVLWVTRRRPVPRVTVRVVRRRIRATVRAWGWRARIASLASASWMARFSNRPWAFPSVVWPTGTFVQSVARWQSTAGAGVLFLTVNTKCAPSWVTIASAWARLVWAASAVITWPVSGW